MLPLRVAFVYYSFMVDSQVSRAVMSNRDRAAATIMGIVWPFPQGAHICPGNGPCFHQHRVAREGGGRGCLTPPSLGPRAKLNPCCPGAAEHGVTLCLHLWVSVCIFACRFCLSESLSLASHPFSLFGHPQENILVKQVVIGGQSSVKDSSCWVCEEG